MEHRVKRVTALSGQRHPQFDEGEPEADGPE
jgi:hypothetical protein